MKDVVDAVVDNEGNAYLLCKLYKGKLKKEEKKKGTRYVYTIIKMDNTAKITVLDTLKVLEAKDSAIVISAKLSVNNRNKVVRCTGNFKTPNNTTELFYIRLDGNNWMNETSIYYPPEFVKKTYATQKQKNKKKKLGLENYKIKNILELDNGEKIIFAEQHYIKVYDDKSEGRQALHTLHNIFVARVSSNDSIQWIKLLPKRQTGGGEEDIQICQKNYTLFFL